ncbi:MAG: hypothetical protein QN152_08225 [Armatimonadota bacterium]|nr:hypothetical protein [Armatimonadota bacterium]MDR7427433.1 hypothetical protein [Armatimonadota bacterium]MDR7463913.1 hypothetical protein [Armatimonadota bacterium]MDR7470743.1 hypothetical protein [Armatimonadota bacterium]MDR7475012.1 hypothetical protein [Armatimonadota bacterium]
MAAMVRCDNCGYQNPQGALVCRRCRRRLRTRPEPAGPRRQSEAELTLVVADGLTRLAMVAAVILGLADLLAFPLYRRVAPGMLILTVLALLAALVGRWRLSALRSSGAR